MSPSVPLFSFLFVLWIRSSPSSCEVFQAASGACVWERQSANPRLGPEKKQSRNPLTALTKKITAFILQLQKPKIQRHVPVVLHCVYNPKYIKKLRNEFRVHVLNCSYESITHLVEEVKLIQPLQAATSPLVKISKKQDWGWKWKICCSTTLQTSPRLQTYGCFSRESGKSSTSKLQSLEGRTS